MKMWPTSGFASAGLTRSSFSFSNSGQLHIRLDLIQLTNRICFHLYIFIQLLVRAGRINPSRRTQSPKTLGAIMKFLISLLISYSLVTNSYGQLPPDLKTDEACLKFIRKNIKGMRDFYFDTIFSISECKKLTPSFKSWQCIDLNGDKKPDIIFVGAFKDANYRPNTAMLYVSNDKSYNLISIVRQGSTSFRPHVFTRKQNGQTLIIVHNYYFSGFQKVETLLINRELSRETCAGDDTLMYKYGSVLDYSSHPSNIKFDSLILVRKYGWSCNVDSFVIYNNGSGNYYGGCRYQNSGAQKFQKSITNINYLKYLVRTIDINKMQRKSIYGGIDNNSAMLLIYHNNIVDKFFDYGLESSFTLKAIYKYFEELQQDL